MKTYQDLLACGPDGGRRARFILAAIADHKSSALYKTAADARLYYQGENPTIGRYEKILYDMQGKAHRDLYTANHKLASGFFRLAVDQENSYLLGNGVGFRASAARERLGAGFDREVSRAAEYALIGGVSFGFWNLDHLEVFEVTEFAPLYDEETGALMAGVRFWQLDDGRPLRCTLYEPDGYAEYIRRGGGELASLRPKTAYKLRATAAQLGPAPAWEGENYPAFPIVPLKNNRECRSELCGRRNTIDALDLVRSGMVNNVDEGSVIYWALTNCGGMDYADAERFLYTVKTSHVAFMDGADEGSRAEPHTVEMPVASTQAAIEALTRALYEDFQAFDPSAVTAGGQTATAIKASYAPLDLKTDRFERQVTEFICGILRLAGVEDEPTYTRNQIVNRQEEIQSVLMAAPYVTSEYLTRKLLSILGDADRAEDILRQRAAEGSGRLLGPGEAQAAEGGLARQPGR